MVVDSYRFLPRSFRPMYEGKGPLEGEAEPIWAPFDKRLAAARIGLLSSAGLYLKSSQPSFDLDAERERPEWGDPGWRPIPQEAANDVAVAHLHINDSDILADPEIALPRRGLAELAAAGVVGSVSAGHASVMGYQDRSLQGWREATAPALLAHFRDQEVDGLVLAPA